MKATYHNIPRETATKWAQEAIAPVLHTVEKEVLYIHGFEIDKDRIRGVQLLDNGVDCDIVVTLNPPASAPV